MDGMSIALMVGGLAVVFLVLAILILFITIMGSIFKLANKRTANKPAAVTTPAAQDVPDPAFIAAITAAIHKVNPVDEGRSLRIKSIIPANAAHNNTDPALIAAVTAAINKVNPIDDDRNLRIKSIRKA